MESRSVVVTAPPGSGKTTRLPLALLESGALGRGQLVLLQPRRVAARAAARRLASSLGEEPGGTVGWATRDDVRAGPGTRILVATEGILTRRLLDDAALEGVSAVMLDEFHERSRHTDLAAAFLREVAETLRPDLLLVAASATLDAQPVACFLGRDGAIAPHVAVDGGLHPVAIRWSDRLDSRPIPLRAAAAVHRALSEVPSGDVLVFLAGAAEIRKTAEALGAGTGAGIGPLQGVLVLPLHGELPAAAQDAALDPAPAGRRKVILATNVAESSLTIPGVVAVVDSGEAKVLRFDPRTGLDRLEKGRISRASASQRAGRAGRLGPGTCYRLWTREEERSFADFETPEVLRTDLAETLLALLAFSPGDPARFGWFEAPPPALVTRGLELLRSLGALPVAPGAFVLTERGRLLSRLALPPRLGTVAVEAATRGRAADGALVAALLAERDVLRVSPFGGSREPRPEVPTGLSDVLHRLELVREAERGGLAPALLDRLGLGAGSVRAVLRGRDRVLRSLSRAGPSSPGDSRGDDVLLAALLAGYPDRVARRVPGREGEVVLRGGRRALLGRESCVREAPLLVALDVAPGGAGPDRVSTASANREEWLDSLSGERLKAGTTLSWDASREAVVALRHLTWGGLVLDEREIPVPPGEEAEAILVAEAGRDLGRAMDLASPRLVALRGRIGFVRRARPDAGIPEPDDGFLAGLLPSLAQGKRRLSELREADLPGLILSGLTFAQRKALDELAPTSLPVPTGRDVPLDWSGPVPVLAVKLQELFGLAETPRVAGGRVPVLLHLLSPAGRPVQVTQDLASFWNRTYPEVRKELRGRYPRHPWPEDPWNAPPTRGAKRRGT